MGIVEGVLPGVCPGCQKIMFTRDWNCISIGSERSEGNNYSISKGIFGGLLGMGTSTGFSHSKGSLKSTRIDLYQCPNCGKTVQRKISTFW